MDEWRTPRRRALVTVLGRRARRQRARCREPNPRQAQRPRFVVWSSTTHHSRVPAPAPAVRPCHVRALHLRPAHRLQPGAPPECSGPACCAQVHDAAALVSRPPSSPHRVSPPALRPAYGSVRVARALPWPTRIPFHAGPVVSRVRVSVRAVFRCPRRRPLQPRVGAMCRAAPASLARAPIPARASAFPAWLSVCPSRSSVARSALAVAS